MKITNCADALRRHHFEVETVRDTDEAFAVIKAAVETERPETVSFGDSMSMRATGVIEWLRGDGRYRLLDGFDPAMTYPQRLEIRRQALMSDLFITGVNAVTAEGTLHWLDKVGNRIAPVAFGPRKVIIRRAHPHDRSAAEHSAPPRIPHALRQDRRMFGLQFARPGMQHPHGDAALLAGQARAGGADRPRFGTLAIYGLWEN